MEKILSCWTPIEVPYIWDEYDLVKAFEKRKKEINMTEQTIKFRDPVVQCVVNKFVDRSDVGFAKYGKTLREDDSDVHTWLNHLQEELMDATLYLQRLKEEIATLREEKELLKSLNDIDVIDSFVFEQDKKKQSKDTLMQKKRKNGHGRNWTIDEDYTEEKILWYETLPQNYYSNYMIGKKFLKSNGIEI